MGGIGGRRSVALAAPWADEYNTIFAPPEICRKRRTTVAKAWERAGPDPDTRVFSLMTRCIVGEDCDDVRRRALPSWP